MLQAIEHAMLRLWVEMGREHTVNALTCMEQQDRHSTSAACRSSPSTWISRRSTLSTLTTKAHTCGR